MAKKETSTDQLITTILKGIEEVKGQEAITVLPEFILSQI